MKTARIRLFMIPFGAVFGATIFYLHMSSGDLVCMPKEPLQDKNIAITSGSQQSHVGDTAMMSSSWSVASRGENLQQHSHVKHVTSLNLVQQNSSVMWIKYGDDAKDQALVVNHWLCVEEDRNSSGKILVAYSRETHNESLEKVRSREWKRQVDSGSLVQSWTKRSRQRYE